MPFRRGPRGANPETLLSKSIQERLSFMGDLVIWRNNSGKLEDRHGRWVTYGLGAGGADLVGCLGGRFFALEVKRPGGHTDPQRALTQAAWRGCVHRAGGFAAVVCSVDDAVLAADRCREGALE